MPELMMRSDSVHQFPTVRLQHAHEVGAFHGVHYTHQYTRNATEAGEAAVPASPGSGSQLAMHREMLGIRDGELATLQQPVSSKGPDAGQFDEERVRLELVKNHRQQQCYRRRQYHDATDRPVEQAVFPFALLVM